MSTKKVPQAKPRQHPRAEFAQGIGWYGRPFRRGVSR